MKNNDTKKEQKNRLVLDGLKAVGDTAGIKASRSKIKKEVNLGFGIVNQLTEMIFTKKGKNSRKEIELAGLGLIAAYNIYRGFKRKSKSPILKGAVIAGILATAIIVDQTRKRDFALDI